MHAGSASSQLQSHCRITYHLMWFCCHLLTVSGLVFQPLGWTPSQIHVFNLQVCLYCSPAGFIVLCTCSTPVLHHCQSVPAPVSVDVLTSVGAFSSFCHADTISHARWCSLLSYVHYWKRERERERSSPYRIALGLALLGLGSVGLFLELWLMTSLACYDWSGRW